jgi:hypothetical protein
MSKIHSLKKQVETFGQLKFNDIFQHDKRQILVVFVEKMSTQYGGLFVVPFVIILFILSQILHPSFLPIIIVPKETARIIIDQRTTNIAALFSISLVIIGWLFANISNKESISFEMLFKQTYLYPTFYFIITLIICLMLCSLLRDETWMDLGNAVVCGTYMIIAALVAITFLFGRLLVVVKPNFFFNSLEKEILKEARFSAKNEIIQRASLKIYKKFSENFGFEDKIVFGTNLQHHRGVTLTLAKIADGSGKDNIDLFSFKKTFIIKNVRMNTMDKYLKQLILKGINYYVPIRLGMAINENFCGFYLSEETTATGTNQINNSIKIKEVDEIKSFLTPKLDYLCKRFEKDVEAGNKENIERELIIFTKVFDLENRVNKDC